MSVLASREPPALPSAPPRHRATATVVVGVKGQGTSHSSYIGQSGININSKLSS